MIRFASVLSFICVVVSQTSAWQQDKALVIPKKLPDGVYAVQRDSLQEKDVRPLKEGEVLVVDRQRYAKTDKQPPARFVVVRSAPNVTLDLAAEPQAIKEGAVVVRIQLKLKPPAAARLERLTRDHKGRQIAIVIDGEIVTMHKIRDIIKGGDVQITSCAEGAAEFLLEKLKAHYDKK
jgi:preprotein translocase subunit SecD